jgi:hypothetical protein
MVAVPPNICSPTSLTLAIIEKIQLRLQIGDLLHQVGFLGCDIFIENGRATLSHHAPPTNGSLIAGNVGGKFLLRQDASYSFPSGTRIPGEPGVPYRELALLC